MYYRVAASAAAAARLQVQALHDELRRTAPDLDARLLRRADDVAPMQTWMEIYTVCPQRDADGVSPRLQAEIEAAARRCLTLLEGPRHVEVFAAWPDLRNCAPSRRAESRPLRTPRREP